MSTFMNQHSQNQDDQRLEEAHTFAAQEHYDRLRSIRVRQITLVIIFALLGIAVIQTLQGEVWEVVLLCSAAVGCIGALKMLNEGRIKRASTVLMILLTVLAFFLAATGGGLRDVVIFSFPGLVIISTMLISTRRTLVLLVCMIAYLSLMGYGTEAGWWQHKTEKTGLLTAINLSIILSVIGFSIYVLHRDIVRLLQKVRDENARYLETRQHVQHIALHDALTGLPNRRLARERFINLFDLAKRHDHKLALMFIDLDDFKTVNDSSGHEAGDRLLQVIAQRLQETLRESDTVCRLGGDEFLVIANDVRNEEELGRLADKLIDRISQSVKIGDMEHRCSGSIGITIAPQDGDSFDALLKNADMAMYLAKKEGRNNYQYFDDSLQDDANRRVELVNLMRQAIQGGSEFSLVYQPKVRLVDSKVIGAEALLRWENAKYGTIPPNELIPLAETSGLIHDLGTWVFSEACKDLRFLHSQGYEEMHFSINVSVAQLHHSRLRARFADILDQQGLKPEAIDLEMTETLLAEDHSQLSENLDFLRKLGLSLSIDDFGTGYSNLGYLKRFDVETLKIDRSFVHELPSNSHNQAIVRAIMQICEELGMKAVAEGVEDQETLSLLEQLGCDEGQGYYWSKPLSLPDLLSYLEKVSSSAA